MGWVQENEIDLHTGTTVTRLDPVTKLVATDNGLVVSYDKLILATGSKPFILPVPGADKQGIVGFRDDAGSGVRRHGCRHPAEYRACSVCRPSGNRGIVVDDYMRTSASGVYAVGECNEHRGISYGLVAPLFEQGWFWPGISAELRQSRTRE